MSVAMECLSGSRANLQACVDADLAGRAIRISGIHCDHADSSCAARHVFATDNDRCGHDAIAGKHGSRAGRCVGYYDGKVGFAAGLDSSLDGSKAEANRQRFRGEKR